MRREHIGALPVLEHGRLAGIISLSDLADLVAGSKKPASGISTLATLFAEHVVHDHLRRQTVCSPEAFVVGDAP
jgi:CBS domain-containing protein